MKTKTDLYTKVVLTVIAIFLGILIFKDVDFVTKAQASPVDLSALNIEKADDDEGITFFIYENNKLRKPFTKNEYYWYDNTCTIGYDEIPSHIITTRIGKGSDITIKRWKK